MALSDAKRKIYLKFAREGIKRLEDMMIDAMNLKTKSVEYDELNKLFKDEIGQQLPLRDKVYYTVSLPEWKRLIKWDWTNKREYISDKRDCDDFAEKFSANMSWLYGVNTAFPVSVQLLDPDTGKYVGYHRAILLVTIDDKIYMYDPMYGMDDECTLVEDPDNIVLADWQYNIRIVRN